MTTFTSSSGTVTFAGSVVPTATTTGRLVLYPRVDLAYGQIRQVRAFDPSSRVLVLCPAGGDEWHVVYLDSELAHVSGSIASYPTRMVVSWALVEP